MGQPNPMAKSRGRPRTPAIPGRTYSLGIIVEGDLKGLIERAADASGLTQSQEAALRLRASFDRDQRLGGGRVAALLEAMGAAALSKVGADWIGDPERFPVVELLWQDMLTAASPVQQIVRQAEVDDMRAQFAQNPQALAALEILEERLKRSGVLRSEPAAGGTGPSDGEASADDPQEE